MFSTVTAPIYIPTSSSIFKRQKEKIVTNKSNEKQMMNFSNEQWDTYFC